MDVSLYVYIYVIKKRKQKTPEMSILYSIFVFDEELLLEFIWQGQVLC